MFFPYALAPSRRKLEGMATIYVKVPDSALQRGFVTNEDMGMTGKQFTALMRAGFCIKPVIASAMNRLDMEPEITPTLQG